MAPLLPAPRLTRSSAAPETNAAEIEACPSSVKPPSGEAPEWHPAHSEATSGAMCPAKVTAVVSHADGGPYRSDSIS
jgi:hypothetical protein